MRQRLDTCTSRKRKRRVEQTCRLRFRLVHGAQSRLSVIGLLLALAGSGSAQEGRATSERSTLPAPAEVRAAPTTGVLELAPADGEPGEELPPWGRELGEPSPLAERGAPAPGLRFWLNVEYLLWWTRNGSAPPLVTKGELSDPVPGALWQPFTKILYGGVANDINFEERHGGRFTFGMPLDVDGDYGIMASYLFLTARATGLGFVSPGNPILAQPFFNVLTGMNDSSLVTYPGAIKGEISVRSTSFLQGTELNGTMALWQREGNRLVMLAGFRYLDLHEDLQVNTASSGVPSPPPSPPGSNAPPPVNPFAGAYFIVQDRFATWSDFYGAQVGMLAELHYRRLQLNLLGKVAIGDSHDLSQVTGRSLTNFPAALAAPAGLLALPSNSGRFTRNAFAVVPEVGAALGLRITDRVTVFAGYTFLYWNNVARPGSQVDLRLNPNLIPTSTTFGTPGGPALPAGGVRTTEFWAQGVSAGLLLRY